MSAAGGVSPSFRTPVALLPFSSLPPCRFTVVEHALVLFDHLFKPSRPRAKPASLPHCCWLTPFPPNYFSFYMFELCPMRVIVKAGDMAVCELSLAVVGWSNSSAPRISACSCCWGSRLQGREHGEVWGGRTDDVACFTTAVVGCLRGGEGQVCSGASGWCESPSSGGFSPSHAWHRPR